MGLIQETSVREYTPTSFTLSLSNPLIGEGYSAMVPSMQACAVFHEYSRTRGHANPEDPTDTPNQFAFGTDLAFFPFLQARGYVEAFNHHMGGYKLGCRRWMDGYFPVRERLVEGADGAPGAVFLVDMGGNLGHELALFQKLFPDHPGRLILQDLPMVIADIKDLDDAIEPMAYDIFARQPIKGMIQEKSRVLPHAPYQRTRTPC